MPGLNCIVKFDRSAETAKNLAAILETMNYDESYYNEKIYSDSDIDLIFSGYKGYPIQKFDLGGRTLVLEGAIYNKSMDEVKNELSKILPSILNSPGKTAALTNFIFNTDGEFVIYYIDNASSKMLIFNDAMGRLPSYYYADRKRFILGRALKFTAGVLPCIEPDDYALIEYFLFSVPLGDRTVLKNIYRLMPCTLFKIDCRAGQYEKEILYKYNFDDRWDDKQPEQYVKDLHDLFLESVSNRANYFKDKKQILSLSGGLDSRANLMGLLKCKANFDTITFIDYYNLLARDLPVVETLVEMYGIKNKLFKLIEENIPYMERMIRLKDGTSPMGTMGSVLNSMELLVNEYGREMVFYVGDEGNYISAPRYGGRKPGSTPELLRQIMLKNSLCVFSIEEAAGLFGKPVEEITDYLCDYFDRYPEKDNIHRIDHFFIWERSFKFTMENQDRPRHFFWPLAPHYGIKYAPYAFKIKNKYLAGWKIYAALLRSLDKRSASVKYANFGIALDSPLMPAYLRLRGIATGNEAIRHNLLLALRLIKNPKNVGRKAEEFGFIGELKNYISNITSKDDSIRSILDTEYLNSILVNEKYIYKLYIAANMTKYLSLLDNKKMPVPVRV